jgi:hypothetical protein
MARPTEPGYYWLRDGLEWAIVKVEVPASVYPYRTLQVWHVGWEGPSTVLHYADDAWGGKITQEPAPDPPPPF